MYFRYLVQKLMLKMGQSKKNKPPPNLTFFFVDNMRHYIKKKIN